MFYLTENAFFFCFHDIQIFVLSSPLFPLLAIAGFIGEEADWRLILKFMTYQVTKPEFKNSDCLI